MRTTATLTVAAQTIALRLPATLQLLLLTFVLLAAGTGLNAQVTKTSMTSGNWSAITWNPAGAPAAGDNIIINTNVTVNTGVNINNLTINASASLNLSTQTVTVNGTTLVNGSLTDNNVAGTNTFNGSFTVSSTGSFSTTSSDCVFGGSISNDGTLSKTGSGALTFNNTISIGGSGAITLGGTTPQVNGVTTLTNTGSLTFPNSTTIANTGSLTCSGSGPVNFSAGTTTINGAALFNGSGLVTFTGPCNINAALTISSGASVTFSGTPAIAAGVTVTNQGTASIAGALNGGDAASTWVNAAGSVLNYSNATQPMATGILNASAATNTVNYSGTNQTVKGTIYNTLTFAGSGTKTAGGHITVATAFNIPADITFAPSMYNFTAQSGASATGTFGDINTNGTNTFNGSLTLSGTGNHAFQSGAAITGDLVVNGSGSVQMAQNTGSGGAAGLPSTVGGNLTVANGSTLYLGNGSFTVTGTSSISGLVRDNGNSTEPNTFNGAVTVTTTGSIQALTGTSGTPFYMNNGLSNAGNIEITAAGGANSGGLIIEGNVINTGTFIKGSTSTTNIGAALAFETACTFTNTAPGTVTVFGPVVANGNTVFTGNGAYTFTGSSNLVANANISFTSSTPPAFTGASLAVTSSPGTFTFHSGSTTVAGAATFNGTSTIIPATSTIGFNGTLMVAASGSLINNGIMTLTGASTITGALTNNGTLTANGNMSIQTNGLVTNNGQATINGNLSGSAASSTWVNAANSQLTFNGNDGSRPLATGTLDASGLLNTVRYARTSGTQQIKSATYHHLVLEGSTKHNIDGTQIVVNGNFTRAASTPFTFQTPANPSHTITFASNSTATFTLANESLQYGNIFVDKSGGSVTLVPGGAGITTTLGTLQVISGSINLGSTNSTVIVNGNLSGEGNIDMSGATHQLTLRGANNALGSLTSHSNPALGTVTYDRSNNHQTIFGSENYNNLIFDNSGANTATYNRTLSGTVGVRGTLSFNHNILVILENYEFKFKPGSVLASDDAFGNNRKFVTNGTGALVREGNTAANYIANMYGTGLFPLGNLTGGAYTPFRISSLTASFSPTAALSVRAIPERQPNIPYYNNALLKYWDVQSTNMSGVNATFSMEFVASEVPPGGSQSLYEVRKWDGSNLITPPGASAPGSNPIIITNSPTFNGQWTAMDPTIRTTIYSYQSGDWSNANTWTTDPSGSTQVAPIVPGPGDQVVILNGRTVNTSVAREIGSLTIQAGGILDLGSSSGHNLGSVSGDGTLRLSSVNFPSGTFTNFVSATGGTIEYYNLPASPTLAATQTIYNNLLFTNSSAANYTVTTASSLTINGNFNLSKSGAGTVTFHIGSGAAYTTTIWKNVSVGAGCTFGITPAATQAHTVNIHGNLVNDGTIDFQNGAAYTDVAGRATLNFLGGTSNTTATFNAGSVAQFFNVVMSKNDGYELYMSSSASSTVQFHGNGATIRPTLGTLRLGPNLSIDRLQTVSGANYDLGAPGQFPVLWIDGATVKFGMHAKALVPYGTLRITAGSLVCNEPGSNDQGAVVIRESGLFQIDGGTASMKTFRTSTTATTHRGSFVMTGGTLNIDGTPSTPDAIHNHYASFSLPYPENVFKMSGGTINVTRTFNSTPAANGGGFMIASAPQNYDVTGGTVNISTTGNINFKMSSTAPFYNLNFSRLTVGSAQILISDITWNYDGGSGHDAIVPATTLTVLNNLTIDGDAFFNAQGNNVRIMGNYMISNGVFTPGANVLIFNGNGAQTFTINGIISGGLNNLTLNKGSNSTLTLAGSAGTITANGALTITAGTLADGGKTLNVGGNITNNGTHTGSGKIVLNGTDAQTMGGNGNGQFQNLEIAGTAGAAITALNHLNVNGNISFTANRILNISIYKLALSATSVISGTNASRYIETDGFQSDGGIVKPFNNTSAFVFPFGTGGNYTPATIQFSSAPGTWGTLDVRPVASKQLYVTDPDVFPFYWKIRQNGFTGVPANSINHTFNYGSMPDNPAYIPGYYNYSNIAFTSIPDVNQVNESTNNIHFTGVSYFDGDFTAGIPAAFGVVVPYYSRTNGNWNVPLTWSNTGHNGAPSATIPDGTRPVFIGDGTNYFHTVTVTANNTYSGSLIVDAGSTLDLGSTTGNNFGALPYSTAGGAGKIRISSALPTAEFPAGDFGLFFTLAGGTTEYYTSGTDFTLPLVTAAPTSAQIRTYKTLQLSPGSGSRTITLPNRNIEIYQNLIVEGGSASGIAAFNDVASRTVTVRGDVSVNTGILRFKNNSSQSLVVDGNISIGTAGTFDVENSGSRVHTVSLQGSLINNGSVSFNQASDVNISFLGNLNRSITGTNASATTSLNQLTINKGTSYSVELNLNVAGTFTVPTNNWLNLVNGALRISRAGTLTLTDQSATNFLLPATSAIVMNHSGAVLNVAMADDNTSDFVLGGKLEIGNGTVNIGNSANATHNDLEYAPTGFPELIISGNGALYVNGQIRRSINVLLGALRYTQKDNSYVLVRGRNPEGAGNFNLNRAKFEILNPGSSFTMQDNAQLVIDRTGQASGIFGDFYLDPVTALVTGGDIRFGTGNSAAGAVFRINSMTPFWHLSVDGTITNKFVTLLNNPVSIQRNLTIEGSSEFRAAGFDVTIGGNLTNLNPATAAGVNATTGYRPGTAEQTTFFTGTSGNQTITGSGSNLTNFANLVLNNTSGNFILNSGNLRVGSELKALNGNVNAGTNNITVTGNIENNRSISNTGAGFFAANGTALQVLHGNGSGSFGNFRLNNSAGMNMTAPFTINGTMNLQNGIFYINNHLLTFGASTDAVVTGTLSATRMIRLNGVTSDGGVRKMYPAAPQNFKFPVGVTLKYTPVDINVTANSVAGSVTVKPVNVRHPATTDPLDKELLYYWSTSATGFNASTQVTHVYTYLQVDATNGTESLYKPGRYFENVWTPQFGINAPSSVNATANTITVSGVNYFNGDYTAGEQSEFDQLLIYYSRNATSGGNWDNAGSWSTDQVLKHAGPAAAFAPSFNSVVIAAGHTITVTTDNVNAPTSQVNGTLNLNNTVTHNFGTVTGTGTIRITPTGSNQFIFPGGNYADFVNTGGGTIEYSSAGTASLPTQSVYNHILFSGAGTKTLANADLLIHGNFTIQAGSVNNSFNRNISLMGNFTNTPGLPGFTSGSGTVILSGTAQLLTGATSFQRLTVNGAGIKSLSSSIDISQLLTLTSGVIRTNANQVNITASGSVSGGSAASYVWGNLRKSIAAATVTKFFEIGDASRYAPVSLSFAGTTNGVGGIIASTTSGDHPNISTSFINGSKSANRYWTLTNAGVTSFTSYNATFNFNAADLDGGAATADFSVGRHNGVSWTMVTPGIRTATSTQATGLSPSSFGDFQVGEAYLGGITWNGSQNADWNNSGNWTPNIVPEGTHDVTINTGLHQPSFLSAGDGTCKNITFNPGTSLTVPTGYTLTVNGNWTAATNTPVNGKGTVAFTSPTATHTGTTLFSGVVAVRPGAELTTNSGVTLQNGASLMHGALTPAGGGTVSGNMRIQRNGHGGPRFNYWSAPINNASINVLGHSRHQYNPALPTIGTEQGLLAGWVPASGPMTVGRGYIATHTPIAHFNGAPNNGPLAFNGIILGSVTNFNLVGNPYPSSLNAASFVAANPHINGGAIYLWDDDNSEGADYHGDDYVTANIIGAVGPNSGTEFNGNIALGQSFFIDAANSNPIQFNNTMRTAAPANFFEMQGLERLWMSVTTQAGKYNETLLAFKADATDEADNSYDAKKMAVNPDIAFYSKIGTGKYAIQALPLQSSDRMIQLGVDASVNGPQTIRLKRLENFPSSAQVILEDTKLGIFQNMRHEPAYSYTFDKNTDSERFRLHFKPAVEMNASTESCVQNDGSITISSRSKTSWELIVRNQEGSTIASDSSFSGTKTIGGLTSGIYTVSMSNRFGVLVQQAVEIASSAPVGARISASSTNVTAAQDFVQFHATVNGDMNDMTWDFGDGIIVTGIASPVHMYTTPGTYTVTFIASNINCMDVKTLTVKVSGGEVTGINEKEKTAFSLFPNPVSSSTTTIRVSLKEREPALTVNLLDAAGKLVKTEVFKQVDRNAQLELNVEGIANGMYQLLIQGETFSTSAGLTITR